LKEGLKEPSNINREFSNLTSIKPPIFLKRKDGYIFERDAKNKMVGVYLGGQNVSRVSTTLRSLPSKLTSNQQKIFLEECILCFEIGAYRSSVVMCWLLTIDTIYEYILKYKMSEFNAAVQLHGKYKKLTIASKDDFNDIKESDFIELLRVSKLISNDTRKILDEKLHFRNTCAHPNSIVIKDSKAIAFIEDLVENIIQKYSI